MIKKNFTRKDLSNQIYHNIGFSKNFSSGIIDNFFESLISELIISNKIKISSFGTFKVINKRERIGRNPKTKIEAKISPRKVVKFKPSSFVKKIINNGK
jgi:integration host factor subunit alpha